MTTFNFTGPDGSAYTLNGPEGSTPQQALAKLKQHLADTDKNAPNVLSGVLRGGARGLPLAGGLLNRLDAVTDAGLSYVPGLQETFYPEDQQLKGSFGERYGQALKTQEAEDTAFHEKHPYIDTAAEIAGGVAGTGLAATTATGAKLLGLGQKSTPLLGRMAMGAGSGAALGAADMAIRGGDPGIGGLVGGAAGAAGPVIGKVIETAAAPWARAARAARTPETEAAQQIFEARGATSSAQRMTPAQIAEAQARGQPITLMDETPGRAMQRLVRRAANISPEAQELLDSTIFGRFRDQNVRTARWVQNLSEFGGDAHELDKALTASMKASDRPAYARAYAAGGNGIWSDELAQASQAPVVQNAIRRTMVSAKNDAARMGFPAPENPFRTDAEGRIFLGKDSNGRQLIPSLQFWDYVKRNLDAVAKGGDRDAQEWARLIREHIDGMPGVGPLYAQARAGHAKFMGAKNAMQFGKDVVTPGADPTGGDNRVLRDSLNKFNDPERRMAREGALDQMAKTLLGRKDSSNIVDTINNSPTAKQRLTMMLGQDKYNKLNSWLHVEAFLDRFRTAMGNSTTARQMYDIEAGSVIPKAIFKPSEMLRDYLANAARKLGQGIDERVATKIAEMLTSEDGDEYYKALQMIANNKGLLRVIKIANEDIAPVAVRGAASGAQAEQQRPN